MLNQKLLTHDFAETIEPAELSLDGLCLIIASFFLIFCFKILFFYYIMLVCMYVNFN